MITLLYVPYDSGHHAARMGRGPLQLREHGAADRARASRHDVAESMIEVAASFPIEVGTSFAVYRALADAVRATVASGRFPLVLAGNCGSALGTVNGLHGTAPNDSPADSPADSPDAATDGASPIGVIWLDAHADFNTPESTTTGFLDGMSLAALAGHCWHGMTATIPGYRPVADTHVVLVGARDIDAAEEQILAQSRVMRVEAARLETDGAPVALDTALTELARRGVTRVYLHIDLDVHEPTRAQANQYAVPGGLSPATVRDLVRVVATRFEIAAAALTAYDPSYDASGRMLDTGLQLIAEIGRRTSGPGNRKLGTEAAR